jgi:ubiquinone/menaquinone biosynthesis C-methylase UbiE
MIENNVSPDYAIVTERPGDQVTSEAIRMFHTRYEFARQLCAQKDVLELGCGAALGLSYIARQARSVVGGDYSSALLNDASRRTTGKLRLIRLDAHALPFPDQSFDVILLFEAIYYLNDPHIVFDECKRVLRPDGTLLVCLANCNWPGFNPSPFSTRYFSAMELYQLFVKHNLRTQLYGSFRSRPSTVSERVRDRIRRIAVQGHMIPMSFKAKARLKKLFYGRLKTVAPIEDVHLQIEPLSPLSPTDDQSEYRVLYALGCL